MDASWFVRLDLNSAAEACAHRILEHLEEALALAPEATLAISGGTSAKPMFEALAAAGFVWDRVHVFWVDERAVPPDHARSNYKLAAETFLSPAKVPESNVHRIPTELDPTEAALRYTEDIRAYFRLSSSQLPRFDVIHLGIGADTHIASLFPGEPLISVQRREIAAAVYAVKLSEWRITLLPGPLLEAGHIVFLASGANKAEAVRIAINGPLEPEWYPAQLIRAGERKAEWFLDGPAAHLLPG